MKSFNLAVLSGLCLIAQPSLSASVQEQIDQGYQYCDNLKAIAVTIMEGRQSGKPKALMQFVVKGMGKDAEKIVDFAYEYPVKDTAQEQAFAVNNFSDATSAGCRKSVLAKINKSRANQE